MVKQHDLTGKSQLSLKKRAFITGITGQDGSYLAEFLLEKGYEVGGFIRSSSTGHLGNVDHLRSEIQFFRGSLDDERSIEAAVSEFKPDEIYNLGAEASPADSFKRRVYTSDINALGPLRIYESALRLKRSGRNVKVYQASTSELYGAPPVAPQDENTLMKPNNPYGAAKLLAHHNARILREGSEKLFVVCGILFNHESPRRGMQYVTRKVTVGVACIVNKVKNPPLNEAGKPIITKDWKFEMGALNTKRDWGYAKEYIQAMWLMMQQDEPDEFVIATGETHSIQELLEVAFKHVGLDWRDHVVQNPDFLRPLETGPSHAPLWGNPAKAKKVLGWEAKVKFKELIGIMVDSDLAKFS
ncbi:GDP-mannose 4,6-dehydratase [Candidatus Daviesbacteria bacterium]|nr:GDP-mannose 4,6-dehydratase [Candidatus Daviesbacteria bacterium]